MRAGYLLPLFFFLIFLTYASSALEGDLNNDGNVTSVDALIALKMSVGKEKVSLSADMNGDGEVTSIDAYQILLLSLNREDDLFLQLNRIVRTYDIGEYLKDERMNWIITRDNGAKIKIGVIIKDGRLIKFQQGPIKNPSVNVYTSEKLVRHLLETQDINEFKKSLKNGDIKLEGVGFFNWVRISVMSFFAGF